MNMNVTKALFYSAMQI